MKATEKQLEILRYHALSLQLAERRVEDERQRLDQMIHLVLQGHGVENGSISMEDGTIEETASG